MSGIWTCAGTRTWLRTEMFREYPVCQSLYVYNRTCSSHSHLMVLQQSLLNDIQVYTLKRRSRYRSLLNYPHPPPHPPTQPPQLPPPPPPLHPPTQPIPLCHCCDWIGVTVHEWSCGGHMVDIDLDIYCTCGSSKHLYTHTGRVDSVDIKRGVDVYIVN